MQCWKQLLQLRLGQHQVLLAAQLDVNEHNMPRRRRQDSVLTATKFLKDGWSVKVEHTLAGFQTLERGCLHGTCERGEDVGGGNALLWVLGSVCSSQSQRDGQLGNTLLLYQSAAPQGGKVGDGGTTQMVLNLSEQHTVKQEREAAERATRVAARRWLQHRAGGGPRRASTDASGWTRRVAGGGPGECIACQWGRWSDGPSYPHNRGSKILFRSVPLPLDFSLDGALRKTAWLADRAYGVVTTRMGLAVRVLAADLEESIKLVQPDNYSKFLGELWDVSGLPLSCGPDAGTDFLAGWKVTPMNAFHQGYRRTWVVVRAAEQPVSTKLQHDFGLATVKRATIQKNSTRVGNTKWKPATEQRKAGREHTFTTDLGTKTTKSTAGKRPKKNRQGPWSISVQQSSEPEHVVQCDAPCGRNTREHCGWESTPALATPAAPVVSENLFELIIGAVATAMAPMDAHLKALQTEIIAMKDLDEADGLGDI